MSRKRCQVTFEDLDGIRRSVTVEAESLYEAAALAKRVTGPASALHVDVLEPTVTHRITVGQLRRWLDLGWSNPMEERSENDCGPCSRDPPPNSVLAKQLQLSYKRRWSSAFGT